VPATTAIGKRFSGAEVEERYSRRKWMRLTPVELAEAPVCVAAGEHHYDFSTQRRIGVPTSLASTYAGTQTFNNHGKPIDKDND
jgi:hypothetical protein